MNKMGVNHPPYDQQLKATVIAKVRDEGMTVSEAATQYGVTAKSIYRWLKEGVVNHDTSLVLEVNRLKKELEQAYALIGRATAEMQKAKR
ncbi:MAG TPA: helix-turn-helix domain-containing protein [Nevskiaceae bacterium]|nr:helix-turn-helix domain-containing protein [Nevskiaceae bacterium]